MRRFSEALTTFPCFQGITVYAFEIKITSQLLDIFTEVKVEPVSGIPVYTSSTTTVKTRVAPDVVLPTLINNIAFTSDTTDEMADYWSVLVLATLSFLRSFLVLLLKTVPHSS